MTRPRRNYTKLVELPVEFTDPRMRSVFFEVHRDQPRVGPGDRPGTERAFSLASPIALKVRPSPWVWLYVFCRRESQLEPNLQVVFPADIAAYFTVENRSHMAGLQ